jgi:hypothetical protein
MCFIFFFLITNFQKYLFQFLNTLILSLLERERDRDFERDQYWSKTHRKYCNLKKIDSKNLLANFRSHKIYYFVFLGQISINLNVFE